MSANYGHSHRLYDIQTLARKSENAFPRNKLSAWKHCSNKLPIQQRKKNSPWRTRSECRLTIQESRASVLVSHCDSHINTVTYWFQNKRQTAKKTGACSNPQDASSNISSSGVVNALHSHNAGCQSEGEHCLSSRRAPLKALCVSSSTSSRLSYKGPIARDTTAYTTSMFSHGPPLLAVPIKIEPDHTLIDRDSLTEPRPEISRAGKYRTHQEPRCNPKKRTLEWACEQQIKRMKRTAQGFRLMRDTRGEDKNELRRVFPNPGLYVLAPNHSKHPIESALSLLALSGRPLTHADIGPDLVFCASVLLDLKYSRTNESDALT